LTEPAKLHRYEGAHAAVTWDATRCIHAAECVRRVPAAFDPAARPWIRPDEADAAALADAVNHCPSGALSMRFADGTSAMTVPAGNTCHVVRNGPNYFRGNLVLRQGEVTVEDTRIALCRCGGSQNKPFCDASHRKIGFQEPGALPAEKQAAPDADLSAPATIKPRPHGPIQCDGPLALHGHDGRIAYSDQTFLCRCGGSQNKPYCDGTHRKIGFVS